MSDYYILYIVSFWNVAQHIIDYFYHSLFVILYVILYFKFQIDMDIHIFFYYYIGDDTFRNFRSGTLEKCHFETIRQM